MSGTAARRWTSEVKDEEDYELNEIFVSEDTFARTSLRDRLQPVATRASQADSPLVVPTRVSAVGLTPVSSEWALPSTPKG